MSLRVGSLLYPMRGLSGKILCNFSVFSIMFQLFLKICVILGLLGLYVVTSICGVFNFLGFFCFK